MAFAIASRGERQLAYFTIAFVLFYYPIETWASWPELWDPFYLDAVVGLVLLIWGLALLRRRAASAVGVLGAGYAWMSASGWRSTFTRVFELSEGRELEYGMLEMCFIACSTALTIVGLVACLVLLRRTRTLQA